MFAVIVAGRLPLTASSGAAKQVDPTHLVFPLERAGDINHVTVFMTGEAAFPAGYSATVHYLVDAVTNSSAAEAGGPPPSWKLLGCLRNDKPSAVFSVKGLDANSDTAATNGGPFSGGSSCLKAVPSSTTATLGISVEPDESVEVQMATLNGGAEVVAAAAGQLVKAGQSTAPSSSSIDPQLALTLAPKIGESRSSRLPVDREIVRQSLYA